MNVRALTMVSIAMMTALGCDRLPFLGGGSDQAADSGAVDSAAVVPAVAPDTTTPAAPAPPPSVEPAPTPAPAAAAPAPAPQRVVQAPMPQEGEVPWNPTHTGTVDPGMSSAQVIGIWGTPVAQRNHGAFTFLYFRNGCENRCGTFDVVLLEGDQVVDAVVRGFGHNYSGVSSSPANVRPVPNPRPDSTVTIG